MFLALRIVGSSIWGARGAQLEVAADLALDPLEQVDSSDLGETERVGAEAETSWPMAPATRSVQAIQSQLVDCLGATERTGEVAVTAELKRIRAELTRLKTAVGDDFPLLGKINMTDGVREGVQSSHRRGYRRENTPSG